MGVGKVEFAFPAADWFALIGDQYLPVVSWMVVDRDTGNVMGVVWDSALGFVNAETQAGFVKFVYMRKTEIEPRVVLTEELKAFLRDNYGVDEKSYKALLNTGVVKELARVKSKQIADDFLS
jgi:hypothetical protein